MAWDDSEITPAILLQHMQAMRFELTTQIKNLDMKTTASEKHLTERIDRLDRNLTRQIDAIDQRLDAIEIEMLPKRVQALEQAIGLAA